MDKYVKEQLEIAEYRHYWNFPIRAKFSGTNGESKTLNILYKDWIKIKEILIYSELN
jgi:hypothetical protein